MMSAFHIRRKRKRAGPFLLLALGLWLVSAWAASGCKEEPSVPRQVTHKVVAPPEQSPAPPAPNALASAAEPAPAVAPEPPKESQEIAGYRPKAERDPFKPFITTRAVQAASTQEAPQIKTPLQRYSLDQLKVVGIIAGGKMTKALLEDDVGKGYVVSVGDAVGSEGGKITSIHKDRITIESTYRDVLGNQKVRHITKKLYVSEEGENP